MQTKKNNLEKNSGLVNMAINLAILACLVYAVVSIAGLDAKMDKMIQQSGTLSPVQSAQPMSDRDIERMIIGLVIQKLQEVQK
jgi:hypothetical protein